MKKFLSVFLLTCLCLSLTACGGEDKTTPRDFTTDDAQTLLDSSAFSEPLEAIDLDIACYLYNLDQDKVSEAAVYGSTGATAEELAVFVFSDADAAAAAKANFETRITDRTEAMKDYIPAEVPKLEKAVLEVRGATLLFVVAADYGPVSELLK